jgi:hypothetical protein
LNVCYRNNSRVILNISRNQAFLSLSPKQYEYNRFNTLRSVKSGTLLPKYRDEEGQIEHDFTLGRILPHYSAAMYDFWRFSGSDSDGRQSAQPVLV